MIDILADFNIGITEGAAGVIATAILTLIGKDRMDKRGNRRTGITGKNGINGKDGINGKSIDASNFRMVATCDERHKAIDDKLDEIKIDAKEIRKSQATTNISLAELAILIKKNGHSSPSD